MIELASMINTYPFLFSPTFSIFIFFVFFSFFLPRLFKRVNDEPLCNSCWRIKESCLDNWRKSFWRVFRKFSKIVKVILNKYKRTNIEIYTEMSLWNLYNDYYDYRENKHDFLNSLLLNIYERDWRNMI